MKRNVLFLLLAMTVSASSLAQNTDDDMYFIPSKKTAKPAVQTPQSIEEAAMGNGVGQFDEYTRRGTYIGSDQAFNDTLSYENMPQPNFETDSCWVNGFHGTADDYEYAREIIRYRNPRYAIPYGTQLYFDILTFADPWLWNIYDDGFYLYCFPTFTNRWWWDWRYNHWGLWRSNYYYSYWGWHRHRYYANPWRGGYYRLPWHHGRGVARHYVPVRHGGRRTVVPHHGVPYAPTRGGVVGGGPRRGSQVMGFGRGRTVERGATRESVSGMSRSSSNSSYSRSGSNRMSNDGYNRSSSSRSYSGSSSRSSSSYSSPSRSSSSYSSPSRSSGSSSGRSGGGFGGGRSGGGHGGGRR